MAYPKLMAELFQVAVNTINYKDFNPPFKICMQVLGLIWFLIIRVRFYMRKCLISAGGMPMTLKVSFPLGVTTPTSTGVISGALL